jgi:hypothetical protein
VGLVYIVRVDYIEVRTELANMFVKYDSKFGSLRLQRPSQPSVARGKQHCSWSRIFHGAPNPTSIPSSRPTFSYTVFELSTYLDSDSLNWWQDHKRTYPVLSILVKDVMIILVSTTSFESAFSLSGRLLDDRCRSITPAHVERLCVIKD